MTDTIEQRSCELAVYIIENAATVRSAAKHFGISKSTVHKDYRSGYPNIMPIYTHRCVRFWI